MTEKTGYKYSIKFNQSLSTGVIAFEGYFGFDDPGEFEDQNAKLLTLLQKEEEVFTAAGYKVASIIPNNLKDLGNSKSRGAQALKNEAEAKAK